ncbi:MAG: hypothetical protein WD993_08850 [Thermoleophilaceae bacterium]
MRILVVANQTAESDELLQALRERAARDDCRFTVVIPATPHGISWAADMHAGRGHDEAERHRDALVERLRDAGLAVEGTLVGDPDPLAAIEDAANRDAYDELIVSTLPAHVSKWLHLDIARKAAHATGLPVTHVEASRPRAGT